MTFQINVADIEVEVSLKRIKHMYIKVIPPDGLVRVSAPARTRPRTIRNFVQRKLPWINKHQQSIKQQVIAPRKEFSNGEIHRLWGQPHELVLLPKHKKSFVDLHRGQIRLHISPTTDRKNRETLLEKWFRAQVLNEAEPLIAQWTSKLSVKVKGLSVRRMKSRWGSCFPHNGTIRINTELVHLPKESLEYIVVHEMLHLLEPSHNKRFYALMDLHLPQWKNNRKELKNTSIKK